MQIFKKLEELQEFLIEIRQTKKKIGFVPTMGSIHEGHISLIKRAINLNLFSLVSIFVNPTQFNNYNDYENYPKNNLEDIEILKNINCDALFIPNNKELYPEGLVKKKTIFDFRDILCDKYRPGHFDGVTTVVEKFFDLLKPNVVFFGEKDFQQLKIIEKIVINKNLPVSIYACPSVRMGNGMSYSSRYSNFNIKQNNIFQEVSKILNKHIYLLRKKIDFELLNNLKNELINTKIEKIDYLEIRNETNLLITNNNINSRLFIAFYIDDIRIIDNFNLY